MEKKSVSTSQAPEVIIEQVGGDLDVKGWDRPEVAVFYESDQLKLEEQDDVVRIRCDDGGCDVRLPNQATIELQQVHGNARFKLLDDRLEIEQVHGSFAISSAASVKVDTVHGDLWARGIAGDFLARQVHGNATLRDIEGACELGEVMGNLDLRHVVGSVQAVAHGNVRMRLAELCGTKYSLQADGNVNCRIPEDASLKLQLASHAGLIKVRMADGTQIFQQPQTELTLGEGKVEMSLSAGGVLYLFGEEPEVEEEKSAGIDLGPDFDRQLNEQIQAQIEAQMMEMTSRLNEQMAQISTRLSGIGLSAEQKERIMERARAARERASERAQERVQRAREKLDRKLEEAQRRHEARTHSRGKHTWSFQWPSPPAPPSPPQPPRPPAASEEERMMILRMLEQKKITVEDAEKLLAALEGREG